MAEHRSVLESLQTYIQADAPARASLFKQFTSTLKAMVEAGDDDQARVWARRAVSPQLDYSSLMTLRRFLVPDNTKGHSQNLLRLAILGGPTTIQLRQLIEVFLAGENMAAEIYEAGFGLFRQEILGQGSGLDAFQPQIVFLATGAGDVARYPSLDASEDAVARMASAEIADWTTLWETINTRWNATVLQNNFEIGPGSILGNYGLRHPAARENYLERLNRTLHELAPDFVILHDLRGLAAAAGSRSWFDPRFYLEFKMPCGPECLVSYAHSIFSLLRAMHGKSKKVMVLDLDNTLWGGSIGDLGPGGICLGEGTGEGEAFLAFQKYLRMFRQRGILLAVCSKNDSDRAREPFEKRADMILKLSDFACFMANWENKADNLRVLAEMLELNSDSFVFVDDNPAERALVRRLLPQVAVPDLPEDPAGYVQALEVHRFFETVSFTREDSVRAHYYVVNAQRRELAARSSDLASFLASLAMRMKVGPVNELNIDRAAQLVNRSNQFNLTTRRYTRAQIQDIAAHPDWCTLTFSLQDNLGDNGLISVLFLRKLSSALLIDTWVMSCRVLQRGVEHFIRDELVRLARQEKRDCIVGTYIPTAKNGLVKDHYSRLGFQASGTQGEQSSWSLRLDGALPPLTHFIQREPIDE